MTDHPPDSPVEFQHRHFTVTQAHEHLRISRSFLYKLIAAKKLRPAPALRPRTIFTGRELERFMKAGEK